ncbi:MAG: glutamate-5-semialdehyde dehydrogenase [Victivallaceae bacterium]|nr:glutamate-5-semialdehyde dehydrogenase [Victivallaceae bacterium]
MTPADMEREVIDICRKAVAASRELAAVDGKTRSACLNLMADCLEGGSTAIIEANARDVSAAVASGMSAAMVDRLTLNEARISGMASGLRSVAAQTDPVGRVLEKRVRPNGLEIVKISVPFGVIGMIYESRPNVTSDASGICIKAGNAVVLRGGSEAFESNKCIVSILDRAAVDSGLPAGVVQMLPWTDRAAVAVMLKQDRYIDLVIPRGGEGLIRMVTSTATMPVLKHYKGVCHLFVDHSCDIGMAVKVIVNAKCSRPGVRNALETLLIHRVIAPRFVPELMKAMREAGVEMRGDDEFRSFAPDAVPAVESDWSAEYLDLVLAARVVPDVRAAVDHINTYGSRHSDGILGDDEADIAYFQSRVDSSTVYANASTRFTDGGEFGMGAEIGISTDKLHARGPMGADELTSYKYLVRGNGQIR